jgi:hypothetical protein
MEKVMRDLVALNNDSINLLGIHGLLRESCTIAATAITKAALPEVEEMDATEEIDRAHQHFSGIRHTLRNMAPAGQKAAVCTIIVDAVMEAAQQAASDNGGYRVTAWVFAFFAMAGGAASNVMMELHYS